MRPKKAKSGILSAFARSRRYGRSKLEMLYPMIMSGSTFSTNFRHSSNKLLSSLNSSTCEPTMCAQVLRVKTLRTNGRLSPGYSVHSRRCSTQRQLFHMETAQIDVPWRVTIAAIWITGSMFASGKIPFRPAHSMSKLNIRRGAMLSQAPSGACETRSL
jgi:hypothetical protein